MISGPSSRRAARPPAQCAPCAEPPCPPTLPAAPLSSPRRAGEKGSLHSGLEAAKAGFSSGTFPGGALGAPWAPVQPWGRRRCRSAEWCGPNTCEPAAVPSPGLGSCQAGGAEGREGCLPCRELTAPWMDPGGKTPLGEKHQASGSGPGWQGVGSTAPSSVPGASGQTAATDFQSLPT